MSSKPSGVLTQAEFFTTTHRLTGQVETGPKPLSDLLNDKSQSYLLLLNVYLSRLSDPAVIEAHASLVYLSKENVSFVIVSAREARAPERSRFTAQQYDVLATLGGFELEGTFTGPPRFDLRIFSLATLDPFVTLTEATARPVSAPDEVFTGEAILVNRACLESFCFVE